MLHIGHRWILIAVARQPWLRESSLMLFVYAHCLTCWTINKQNEFQQGSCLTGCNARWSTNWRTFWIDVVFVSKLQCITFQYQILSKFVSGFEGCKRTLLLHYLFISCNKKNFRKYLSCSSFIRAVVCEVGKTIPESLQDHKNGNLTKIFGLEVVALSTSPRERAARRFQSWQDSDNWTLTGRPELQRV
jgi:hypothetical protein